MTMKTNQIATYYVVAYDVFRPNWPGAIDTVALGPDLKGPYTDFEDLRKIIAVRRGINVEDILIKAARMTSREELEQHDHRGIEILQKPWTQEEK